MSGRLPQSNFLNPDINPCIDEARLSDKCMNDELYDTDKCRIYFENYRNCKQFWGMITSKRRKAGITPALPTKKERDEIMNFKKQGKIVISAEISEQVLPN